MRSVAIAVAVLALAIAACGPEDDARPASATLPSEPSDEAICERACERLSSCGSDYGASCASGCLASKSFLPCLRSAALDDCDAVALCSFREAGAELCDAEGGLPAGGSTCRAASDCEAACALSDSGPACVCDCWRELAPNRAADLLRNDHCVEVECRGKCGNGTGGRTCTDCRAFACPAPITRCAE